MYGGMLDQDFVNEFDSGEILQNGGTVQIIWHDRAFPTVGITVLKPINVELKYLLVQRYVFRHCSLLNP
jgi:hypothetical protein